MTQISESLYNKIADYYSAIQVALSGVSTNAANAVYAIVDVDTLDYPNASIANDADALEIELALLQTFNSAYIGSQNIANSTASLIDAVVAINYFVIKNSTFDGTAAEKLTDWINTVMGASWTEGNCSVGWRDICLDAGYTTASWVTA
jgi:hypothetical protein